MPRKKSKPKKDKKPIVIDPYECESCRAKGVKRADGKPVKMTPRDEEVLECPKCYAWKYRPEFLKKKEETATPDVSKNDDYKKLVEENAKLKAEAEVRSETDKLKAEIAELKKTQKKP